MCKYVSDSWRTHSESEPFTPYSLLSFLEGKTIEGIPNLLDCVTEVSNSKTRFEFTIDTTKLTDNIPLDITIESFDRAGNVGTKIQTVNVNQDTDKPVVSFSNVIVTNNAKDNLFGMGSNVLFSSVTDDDGIKSISYTINSKTYSVNMNGLTPTSKSFQFDASQMNLTSGSYDLVVVATDKNNVVSDSYQTVIAYDIELPKITITKLAEDAYTENMWVPSSFVITGTASDDNGIAGVYEASDTQRATNLITQGINSANAQWSYNVSGLSDGVGTRKFFVVDIYGREYSSEISYQIDTVAPVFVNDVNNAKEDASVKIIIESGNSKINTLALGNTWFAQKAVSISGSVTENNLDSLFLVVGESESQFTAASSSGNKSSYKTTYTFEEGTTQFKLKAKDKEIEELNNKLAQMRVESLISSAKEICGLKFICTKFEGISPASLRIMGDHIKFTAQDAIALLASVNEDKVSVLVVCGINALKEGAHAGKIVKEIAAMAGGSGGGRPDSAMGGANPEMIDEALASAAEIVETLLINK